MGEHARKGIQQREDQSRQMEEKSTLERLFKPLVLEFIYTCSFISHQVT